MRVLQNYRYYSTIAAIGLGLSLGGCANARSFFQMSSDSPSPFFGLDFTLPPKLSFRSSDAELPSDGTHQTFGEREGL